MPTTAKAYVMPVYTTLMRSVMRMMDNSVLITARKRGTWGSQQGSTTRGHTGNQHEGARTASGAPYHRDEATGPESSRKLSTCMSCATRQALMNDMAKPTSQTNHRKRTGASAAPETTLEPTTKRGTEFPSTVAPPLAMSMPHRTSRSNSSSSERTVHGEP